MVEEAERKVVDGNEWWAHNYWEVLSAEFKFV